MVRKGSRGTAIPPPASGGASLRSPVLDPAAAEAEADRKVRDAYVKAVGFQKKTKFKKAMEALKIEDIPSSARPLLLRAEAEIQAFEAFDNASDREKLQKKALKACQNACQLAPDSIELARFHISLLSQYARTDDDKREVQNECQRAVKINDLKDPARHSFGKSVGTSSEITKEIIQFAVCNVVKSVEKDMKQEQHYASVTPPAPGAWDLYTKSPVFSFKSCEQKDEVCEIKHKTPLEMPTDEHNKSDIKDGTVVERAALSLSKVSEQKKVPKKKKRKGVSGPVKYTEGRSMNLSIVHAEPSWMPNIIRDTTPAAPPTALDLSTKSLVFTFRAGEQENKVDEVNKTPREIPADVHSESDIEDGVVGERVVDTSHELSLTKGDTEKNVPDRETNEGNNEEKGVSEPSWMPNIIQNTTPAAPPTALDLSTKSPVFTFRGGEQENKVDEVNKTPPEIPADVHSQPDIEDGVVGKRVVDISHELSLTNGDTQKNVPDGKTEEENNEGKGVSEPSLKSPNIISDMTPAAPPSTLDLTTQSLLAFTSGGYQKDNTKDMTACTKDDYDKNFLERLYQSLGHKVVTLQSAGLENYPGDNSCYMNSFIQALWHLRLFREKFLQRVLQHKHGSPCVICPLRDIFMSLREASGKQRATVSSKTLRNALRQSNPDSKFFLEGEMNDPSDLIVALFECMHKSFTSPSESNTAESQCVSERCISHRIFGMYIDNKVRCHGCNFASSSPSSYFALTVVSRFLINAKMINQGNPLDKLLDAVLTDTKLPCNPDDGGCGSSRFTDLTLSSPPDVFIVAVGWLGADVSVDVPGFLACISTEIDMGVVFRGLDQGNKHLLVSLICFIGLHYVCFSLEDDQWVSYSDTDVKVIGDWIDVLIKCERDSLQPTLLFFERNKVAGVGDQSPGKGEQTKAGEVEQKMLEGSDNNSGEALKNQEAEDEEFLRKMDAERRQHAEDELVAHTAL